MPEAKGHKWDRWVDVACALYLQTPLSLDLLPYSDDFHTIRDGFAARTGESVSDRELWLFFVYVRKNLYRLPKKTERARKKAKGDAAMSDLVSEEFD